MKKYIILGLITFFGLNNAVFADGHEQGETEVFNLQVQLCTLKDNASIKQYDAMINDYVKWSRKHDVELAFARQTPLYPHNSWFEAGYDFMEVLFSTHAVSGKGWDKWLGTSDGQKLNERWQKLADCRVKQAASVPHFVNQEAINKDNNRIVSWNWCSLNDGVTWDDMLAEHNRTVKLLEEDNLGIIGWATIYPRIGTEDAPGDFAHIVIYPDMEAAQIYQQAQSDGGWRDYNSYQEKFATCRGDSFFIENVINNPNS
tara:strand:- start:1469 stop:2242 length:774 start_codon:yes stop_codon:yes gene_type:complete